MRQVMEEESVRQLEGLERGSWGRGVTEGAGMASCLGVRWLPGKAAHEGMGGRPISKAQKNVTALATELACIRNDAVVWSQLK